MGPQPSRYRFVSDEDQTPITDIVDGDFAPLDEYDDTQYAVQEISASARFKRAALLSCVLAATLGTALYLLLHRTNEREVSHFEQEILAPAPTLLISIDGFRHDYLERRQRDGDKHNEFLAPTLRRLAKEGTQAEGGLTPVMPTKTFPNHYSIATGLYPESHGIVSNTMYSEKSQKWFHLTETEPEWWHGEPIWKTLRHSKRRTARSSVNETKENYVSATVFWPGSTVDKHKADAFWAYNSSISYEDRVARMVSLLRGNAGDLDGRKADFATLYFEGVDHAGHRHGPNSKQVDVEIAKVDSAIRQLIASLGPNVAQTYNLIVISDHGFHDVRGNRMNLSEILNDGEVQDILTSPFGMFKNMTSRAEVVVKDMQQRLILTPFAKNVDIFLKKDIPERWHLKKSDLIPQIVTMTRLGWEFGPYAHPNLIPGADTGVAMVRSIREKKMPSNHPVGGDHGWPNNEKTMKAIFVGQGPGFKNRSAVRKMSAVDFYPMLCYMFGVQRPAPNNGSLERTRGILRTPAWDKQR